MMHFKSTIKKNILIVATLVVGSFTLPFSVHAFTITLPPSNNLGLVGQWTFDGKDIQNGVVIDKSGQGKNANIINAATSTMFVRGKIGQAIVLNGTDQYLSVPAINLSSSATMSAWIKTSTNGVGIFNHGDLSLSIVFNKPSFSGNSCYSCGAIGSTSMNDGEWHFVVGVVTGNTFYVYVDGQLENSLAITYAGSNQLVTIGKNVLNSGDFFPGTLDDVRMYNRALSSAEIAQLYNSTKGKMTTTAPSFPNAHLIGWWTFDGKDIQNGVLLDKSGQGNSANIINAATSTFRATGILGQAGNFDGVDDAVRMTSNPNSNYANPQTTCVWFKTPVTNVQQTLVSTLTDTNNNSMLSLSSTGIIAYSHKASATTYGGYKPGQYLANTWTLGCGVFDGSSVKIYSNAVDAGSLLSLHVNAAVNGIGKGTYNYKGLIDDVRIYDRALSAAEITQLFNSTKTKFNTAANSSSDSIIGWWTFDGKDIQNGVLLDKSGQGNNGNMFNISTSTFYSIGKMGQAGNFDGTNDYLNIPSVSILSMPQNFTISAWVRPMTSDSGVDHVFAGKSTEYGLLTRSGFIAFNAGASTLYSGSAYVVGTWYHVVGTLDSSGTIALYINGISQSGSINGLSTGITVTASSNPLKVGDNFNGYVDDVRIYNKALNASEVKKLYQTGK